MESKADDLVRQAEDHLPGKWTLWGADAKKEEAAEMFSRAATLYKVAKNWDAAGDNFARAAVLQKQVKNDPDASLAFTEAAKAYANVSHDRAIEIYTSEVIPELLENGRLDRAAKVYQEIAELHEADGRPNDALGAFKQAADLFLASENKSVANKMMIKIAFLSADAGNYDEATRLFEQVAEQCLGSALLKFNAKQHFLHGGLCVLAKGKAHAECEEVLSRWKAMDYSLEGSRECKFLEDLSGAVAEMNAQLITDLSASYDEVSRLDPWKTHILLQIKSTVAKAATETVDLS